MNDGGTRASEGRACREGTTVGMRVHLIGQFGVFRDEHPVRTPTNTDRLIALISLHDGELSRRRAADLLWPDDPRRRAGSHLRTLLYRIRRSASGLITDKDWLLSIGDRIALDYTDWSQWACRILIGRCRPGDLCRRVPAHGFELFEDLDDDWALIERERFRQHCLHALERQMSALMSQERHAEAIDVGLSGVRLDPMREAVHRGIIHCHLANGNRMEAIRHFELYASLLDDQLGMAPSRDLEHLVRSRDGPSGRTALRSHYDPRPSKP